MQHLTQARETREEQAAAATVRSFLQKYEDYFVATDHALIGGANALNFQDCQLILISAHAALWKSQEG